MKKAYLLAAAAAVMMMTGCSDADSNGNKNRTTTATKAAVSEVVSSDSEGTGTSAPQDSSVGNTQTQPTEAVTTTTVSDESSESEPEPMIQSDVKCDSSRISSAEFGIDISYPDGWEVKSYEIKDNSSSQTVAAAVNDDLGVFSTVELITFEDDRKVSGKEYLEKLKQAYTELITPDESDPDSTSDITIEEGSAGDAKTVLVSYKQKEKTSYVYTFVYEAGGSESRFLQFSYAFSESDNTEHIMTALEEMMSR